MMSFRWHH